MVQLPPDRRLWLVRDRGKTRSRWWIVAPLAGALVACGAVAVTMWDGTGTHDLTVPQAAAIAADLNLPPAQRKLAAAALRRAAAASIRSLIQLSGSEDAAGTEARNSLDVLQREMAKR